MTIAQQIKAFHVDLNLEQGLETINNIGALTQECEQKAIETEQDYDNETITYTFVDGSVIVISEGYYVRSYGCKC